jgi:RNA polymerase sigma-70 factor, ECF subfamily
VTAAETTREPPWPDWSDSSLVTAIGRRNGDAQAELYRRHGPSVTAATRMILGRRAVCDDVVAEVFIDLWLAPHKFDPSRGSLLGWLRMRARTRSIDMLRSETSRRRRENVDGSVRPDTASDIESSVLTSETAVELRRAVRSLPPSEGDAIELAYFQGMSYRAVAVRLEVAEGTVKSRIRSGLRRLRADVHLCRDAQPATGHMSVETSGAQSDLEPA